MKPTKAITLISASIPAGILGWGASVIMVRSGLQLPTSTTQLLLMLPTVTAILIVLALPIFKYRSGIKAAIANPKDASKAASIKRVDPFYALRVAMLSKAVSVSGSVFVGWHIGVLVAVLEAPQLSTAGVWRCIFGILGAASMVAAGIVVERSCKVPPDAEGAANPA